MLVTTLTKRMAENLTEYLEEQGIRVRYLHSDIETVERVEIIRDLRLGKFDVLVGINLLREGLDMPEVSLVAILDADKEGFLRSTGSLIQTIGRAARNLRGTAILYADRVTRSMQAAIDETDRRRARQVEYNRGTRHHPEIDRTQDHRHDGRRRATPSTSRSRGRTAARKVAEEAIDYRALSPEQIASRIRQLEAQHVQARAGPRIRGGGAGARRDPSHPRAGVDRLNRARCRGDRPVLPCAPAWRGLAGR